MGSAHERPPAERLLREYSARRDGRRFARQMRNLFRHDRRAGLRLRRWRGFLERNRSRLTRGSLGGSANALMIRVELPFHLQNLAKVTREITLEVPPPVTQRSVLDALEAK